MIAFENLSVKSSGSNC